MRRLVVSAVLLVLLSCGSEITSERPPTTGTIRGELSYPSEFLPAQRVVAFDADTMAPVTWVDTREGQSGYALTVPPGSYCVVAYSLDPGYEHLSGAYTKSAQVGCPMGFEDHGLIRILIAAGQTADDIDPIDWYAPPGAFPGSP
jgi:hypothetical protein